MFEHWTWWEGLIVGAFGWWWAWKLLQLFAEAADGALRQSREAARDRNAKLTAAIETLGDRLVDQIAKTNHLLTPIAKTYAEATFEAEAISLLKEISKVGRDSGAEQSKEWEPL